MLWLVHTQKTLTDAAKVVGLNYDYARGVVKDYNRDGAAGLRNRRKAQRPHQSLSLLNPKQIEDLEARLQSPPDDDGGWSGPKVARVIAEVTGVPKVWPQRGWDHLKRLEQSRQVPRPRHRKGDPEAQEAFEKNSRSVKLNWSSSILKLSSKRGRLMSIASA
ncbi:winged helix-turn-helix domain-containing protein [Thermoleptolyngbya sp. C42_A2020_037]|uniref:winged helix-turn-helix domain-containing protein n=1 Tax=Thermoleptolyngbya sp. C42_A2020_037 TaxID=2747799 RepID=UPI0025CDE742|nr:winged helix-turn-helix domain-containing protein [Thermoleptolyngbya sp. C42_A2020_037]